MDKIPISKGTIRPYLSSLGEIEWFDFHLQAEKDSKVKSLQVFFFFVKSFFFFFFFLVFWVFGFLGFLGFWFCFFVFWFLVFVFCFFLFCFSFLFPLGN